ncbi:hypothetical protein ACFFGH_29090 [Lysobacter korlensis]|uniref:Uncharacterized protein n=1 Tax=Lysobacter korlensis TaxID=553636 RepID=A0ABV6RZ77_9GAMM
MAKASPPPPVPASGSPDSLRAQLLATEHWSLLASRSTAQSEVLVRISILLTLVSAGLVSLALVGQVTDFADPFPLYAVGILSIITLIGLMTQIRVRNVGMEDLMYVLAMNRLRAAYLELDPGIRPYLMAGSNDDLAGMSRTYFFLDPDRNRHQLAGSTMMFIAVVNSALTGLLAAAIVAALGGGSVLAGVVAAVLGLVYIGLSVLQGGREFHRFWRSYEPLVPTPAGGRQPPQGPRT